MEIAATKIAAVLLCIIIFLTRFCLVSVFVLVLINLMVKSSLVSASLLFFLFSSQNESSPDLLKYAFLPSFSRP